MSKPKSIAVLTLLIIVFSVFGWLWQDSQLRSIPDITVTTISGQKIRLSDWRGHPVIVTFWATSCPSCLEEIPHLIEIQKQFEPLGLKMLAVAMYYDRPNHVVMLSRDRQLPYPITFDLHGDTSKAFGNIMLTPTTFLLSPNGEITLQITGKFDLEQMKSRIKAFSM
jgi:thiol-disulfide isomerase/thioredoxin